MTFKVTYAEKSDKEWLCKVDSHLDQSKIEQKINLEQILIAKLEGLPIGFLRFNFFWDEIPFMNMLQLSITERTKGYGKAIVQFWESEMKSAGHKSVMTSTLSNENAKGFYKKLGYEEVGSFKLEPEGNELIFSKTL